MQIDVDGEYSLHCLTCDWQAERGDTKLHTWAERSLDWILLRHMAFAELPDAASTLPVPKGREIEITAPSHPARKHPVTNAERGHRRSRVRS